MPITNEALSEKLDALDERLGIVWKAHEREHEQHEKAHAREHQFAQDAIIKAAELAKENKADANEWRASMNDREAKFATKDDAKTILGRLDSIERVNLVAAERERNEKEAAQSRTTRSMWIVGIMATIGAVLVNAVIRLSGN